MMDEFPSSGKSSNSTPATDSSPFIPAIKGCQTLILRLQPTHDRRTVGCGRVIQEHESKRTPFSRLATELVRLAVAELGSFAYPEANIRMITPPTQQDDHQRQFEVYMPVEGRKPRLSKRFAWPVGLELLSSRFGHIPQAASIRVWFSDHPSTNYTLTMEQIANRGLAYRMLTVWYYFQPNGASWFLMVYPVEASRRAAVRLLLEDSAFVAIDAWLCEARTPVWLGSSHYLDCIFDPTEQTLAVSERLQS